MAQRRRAIRWLMLVVLGLVAVPAAARAEGWGPKSANWVQKWISDVGNPAHDAGGAGGIGRNEVAVGKRAVASVLIQTQTVQGAPTVSYGYDGKKRLTTVTTPHTTINLDYEPGGLLKRIHNGTFDEVYEYLTPSKQLESITTTNANNPVTSFAYTYSPAGNRLTETYSAQGGPAEITEYGYDAADRLTGVRYPNGETELYKLRGDGSRLGLRRFENIPNGIPLGPEAFDSTSGVKLKDVVYGFDARDGLNAIQDLVSGEVGTVSQDAAGRMTVFNFEGVNRGFVWDVEDRLTSLTVNGETTQYEYDWRRWRVRKSGPAGTTEYTWGAEDLLGEFSGWLSVGEVHLRGPRMGLPLGQSISGATILYAHDALGGVVATVNVPPELSRYGAWGDVGSAQFGAGFAGLLSQAESGDWYGRARTYMPSVGRWASADTIPWSSARAASASGAFAYGAANPTRYVDPRGEAEAPPALPQPVPVPPPPPPPPSPPPRAPVPSPRPVPVNPPAPISAAPGASPALRVLGRLLPYLQLLTLTSDSPKCGEIGSGCTPLEAPPGTPSSPQQAPGTPGQPAVEAPEPVMPVSAPGRSGAAVAEPGPVADPVSLMYVPKDKDGNWVPLPTRTVEQKGGRTVNVPLPLPGAEGPHTTLGVRWPTTPTEEPYRQSAEHSGSWPLLDGTPVPTSLVDWSDHGQGWPSPHQHAFYYDGRCWIRSKEHLRFVTSPAAK